MSTDDAPFVRITLRLKPYVDGVVGLAESIKRRPLFATRYSDTYLLYWASSICFCLLNLSSRWSEGLDPSPRRDLDKPGRLSVFELKSAQAFDNLLPVICSLIDSGITYRMILALLKTSCHK